MSVQSSLYSALANAEESLRNISEQCGQVIEQIEKLNPRKATVDARAAAVANELAFYRKAKLVSLADYKEVAARRAEVREQIEELNMNLIPLHLKLQMLQSAQATLTNEIAALQKAIKEYSADIIPFPGVPTCPTT
jgi:chromosome segregation ATPase